MQFSDLISRAAPGDHWNGTSKIPWNDPEFSRRMLAEHLDQRHERASRPSKTIDRHIRWIDRHVLNKRRTRVLDICCGPGLYTSRLAALGNECLGIDFSPASIEYAKARAAEKKLSCRYVHGDVRDAGYGEGFGLGLMLFSEFNTFSPGDAKRILLKLHAALAPGGRIVIEPQRLDSIQRDGLENPTWNRVEADLFSPRPHLYLEEHFWDEKARVATARFYVIDGETGAVSEYISAAQGYTQRQLSSMFKAAGFEDVEFHASLAGGDEDDEFGQFVVCAVKAPG